jgi:hypothetical protein
VTAPNTLKHAKAILGCHLPILPSDGSPSSYSSCPPTSMQLMRHLVPDIVEEALSQEPKHPRTHHVARSRHDPGQE